MSGNSLGNVPQDKNLSNLNVLSTIGQCNTSLRGKCITTNNLNVNYINGIPADDLLSTNDSYVGLAAFRGIRYRSICFTT